jgi:4-amino-4-deoxy-L-arabinose transferase-like glycosyltransferase
MTGFMIFTIWQLYEYLQERKVGNFVLAFVGIGLSILTKGPLGLVIPILAIGPQLVYQKRWKDLFRPEWLLGLLIIAVTLTPMIYSVYTQHGMHGLRFHFWTQSFGRITGENVWQDNTGPLFFVHSFLWSFIPWTLFALVAYVKKWMGAFRSYGKDPNFEIITLSGITLVFIAMSMSSYKLPHYTYVVFPLVAILSGAFIHDRAREVKWEGFGKPLYVSQVVFNLLLWLAVVVSFLVFSASFWIYLVAWFAFSYFFYAYHYTSGSVPKIFTTTLVTMLGVAFILNTHFYPGLNPYQARVTIGELIKEKEIPAEEVMIYDFNVHKATIDCYSERIIPRSWHLSTIDSLLMDKQQVYVVTDQKGMDSLVAGNYQIEESTTYKDYQISLLSLPFLNPKTRDNVLRDLYFVRLEK